jgi:hypothetical protein
LSTASGGVINFAQTPAIDERMLPTSSHLSRRRRTETSVQWRGAMTLRIDAALVRQNVYRAVEFRRPRYRSLLFSTLVSALPADKAIDVLPVVR